MMQRQPSRARAAPAILFVLLAACRGPDSSPDESSPAQGGAGAGGGPHDGAAGRGGEDGLDGEGGPGVAQSGGAGLGPVAPDLVLSPCSAPVAPVLPTIHAGAVLAFVAPPQTELEVAWEQPPTGAAPEQWRAQSSVALAELGVPAEVSVFARALGGGCETRPSFERDYSIRPAYPGPAGQPGSTAIAGDDSRFVGWATGFVEPVEYGGEVLDTWRTPELALGPAGTEATDVVSVGNGGRITLTFDPPIADGAGPDLVVFENGHNDTFLELAFVEVSSDGEHFARFDSAYLGDQPVEQYGAHDTSQFEGLAGKYRVGFGGPFDLSHLRYRPAVQEGVVDLSRITHVRIVDIIGDGDARDSFGHPIYDPTPTTSSGGFDLDAIGVLNVAD